MKKKTELPEWRINFNSRFAVHTGKEARAAHSRASPVDSAQALGLILMESLKGSMSPSESQKTIKFTAMLQLQTAKEMKSLVLFAE